MTPDDLVARFSTGSRDAFLARQFDVIDHFDSLGEEDLLDPSGRQAYSWGFIDAWYILTGNGGEDSLV